MRHAIAKGCGFRADCLGDMGGFSKNWNHMKNLYPQMIEKTGAGDAWKVAPVAYESCWDMRKWVAEGWDVRGIFDYALATHASYLNNKSAPIPEGTRPEVERFLKKLGYRLVLTELSHEPVVSAGAETMISMKWENVGVAPPYRDYLLAFRLTRDGNFSVVVTKESARGWLPGERTVSTGLRLPEDLAAGRYELAVGLVEPGGERPVIRLATQGRDADGWYPVSTIEVK